MSTSFNQFYEAFQSLPDFYQALILGFLAIFLMDQSLTLGRFLGMFAYRALN